MKIAFNRVVLHKQWKHEVAISYFNIV